MTDEGTPIPKSEALIDDMISKLSQEEAAELVRKHRDEVCQYATHEWTSRQFQDHAFGMLMVGKLMLRERGDDHTQAATRTF